MQLRNSERGTDTSSQTNRQTDTQTSTWIVTKTETGQYSSGHPGQWSVGAFDSLRPLSDSDERARPSKDINSIARCGRKKKIYAKRCWSCIRTSICSSRLKMPFYADRIHDVAPEVIYIYKAHTLIHGQMHTLCTNVPTPGGVCAK